MHASGWSLDFGHLEALDKATLQGLTAAQKAAAAAASKSALQAPC